MMGTDNLEEKKAGEEEKKEEPALTANATALPPLPALGKPGVQKTEATAEQKEGGEFEEFYEGGQSDWIDIQKFKQDLEELNKLTRSKAKSLIE